MLDLKVRFSYKINGFYYWKIGYPKIRIETIILKTLFKKNFLNSSSTWIEFSSSFLIEKSSMSPPPYDKI